VLAHRSGLVVELERGGDERAAALGGVPLEPALEQVAHPWNAAGRFEGRADDVVDEPLAAVLEHLDLQRLLGAEVGEEAALAHLGLGGEGADREASEPDPARQSARLVEDGHAGRLTLAHAAISSTIVRISPLGQRRDRMVIKG
jgi:hypothetical protein